MKSQIIIPLSLSLLFAVGEQKMGRAIASRPLANGQILQTRGEVYILRSNGRRIRPTPGTPIYPRDRLETEANSQILLQCDDLNFLSVSANQTETNRCQLASKPDCTKGTYKCPNRGDKILWHDLPLPYIISPRRTALLNDKPLLRWNPVPDATTYTVSIEGEGVNWTTQTQNTQIRYPGEQPLKPGGDYLLIVDADTGESSLTEPLKLGGIHFRLLDTATAAQIEIAKTQIAQQSLSSQAETLALTRLYLKYRLNADAIETLEELIDNGTSSAPLYRLLGDLYLKELALPPQAQKPYTKAVELANPDDLEEQTAALDGLGQTEAALGNITEAIRWLTQAQERYETLGNLERVEELRRQIKDLSNLSPQSLH